ncbi:hypothetical protein ACE1CI_10630 [Aerosakkonemataceae cyanobacterium BLCC-F50]|uniref:Uncharacterized protein n=1 Tax=Floridaenema flaviceps BLCC-F50 TaxID=3153642 RepID=A0ABV4XQG8_9CYAN
MSRIYISVEAVDPESGEIVSLFNPRTQVKKRGEESDRTFALL